MLSNQFDFDLAKTPALGKKYIVHFNKQAIEELGKRYYSEFVKIIENK